MGLPALDPDDVAEVVGDEAGDLFVPADRAIREVRARFRSGSIDHLGAAAGRPYGIAERDVVAAGEEGAGGSRVAVQVVVLRRAEGTQRVIERSWHLDS